MKHCPKCGSTDIGFPLFYRPSIWRCSECGYEGAFIIEDGRLAEKRRIGTEVNAASSVGWKENLALTIGAVKWTDSEELHYG